MTFSIILTARSQLTGTPSDGNTSGITAVGGPGVSFTLQSATSFDSLQVGVTQVTPLSNGTSALSGTWIFQGYLDIGGKDYIVLQQDSGSYFTFGIHTSTSGTFHAAALANGTDYVCYLRGTRIMTDRGAVEIESLSPGDHVVTKFGGLRPIKWIGRQRFSEQFSSRHDAPVRFAAGSLGDNRPERDLYVSPAHTMFIDDHLVAASLLLNDMTITQEKTGCVIEYYHLDLGVHDCVLAEGAWSESYREDDGNRSNFHNAASFVVANLSDKANIQLPCLPCVNTGDDPRLHALRAMVAPRLGRNRFSTEADVHFLADGEYLAPLRTGTDTWRAIVPANTQLIRLRTRATRPIMVDGAPDHRALGLCVHAIQFDNGQGLTELALDHPSLGQGFHCVECDHDRMWRWTDGDAAIPVGVLANTSAPLVMTIQGRHQALNFLG